MPEDTSRLIGLIYEAAAAPMLWNRALASFAGAVHATDAHIIAIDKHAGRPIFAVTGTAAMAREFFPPYFQAWALRDPLIPKMLAAPKKPGSIMLSQHYLSATEFARSDFFQDFAIPLGLRHQAAWVLDDNPAIHAVVDLHHGEKPFEYDWLTRWDEVIGHLRRALRLGLRLAELEAGNARLRGAMDRAQLPWLTVDDGARVLDQSSTATTLLENNGAVRVVRGYLRASAAQDSSRLLQLIAAAARGHGGGELRLTSPHGVAVELQVVPAGTSAENPFSPLYANCALIFIRQRVRRRPPSAAIIRSHLRCSLAEAQVAAALVSGQSPHDIAVARRVSIHTVRSQIRALFVATNTARIGELIAAVCGL